jgi:hypothetical protein
MRKLTRTVACLLGAALLTPLTPPARAQSLDAARVSIMRAYLERIPPGSRVRVTLMDGKRIRGTFMLLEGGELVVRERTRLPEPPLRLALNQVADVELDRNGGGVGKAIAIGAGAGAAAALGVFLVILAAVAD